MYVDEKRVVYSKQRFEKSSDTDSRKYHKANSEL